MNFSWKRCSTAAWLVGISSFSSLLAGCSTPVKTFASQEDFASTVTYSRLFDATAAQTCEASRRALLSQGYLISTARDDLVEGRKNFQPEPEAHVQMEIRIVCAPDTPDGKVSLGFVTALQDVYTLKKINNSASLGVGALGSVSLPFSSSSDAMIKVASKTITSDNFYERFFDLVKRYLVVDEALDEPRVPVKPVEVAKPAP
ncbi:MAG: putative lipoprotein [Polaromonas sp.]|nr:putative lipoprotein [Polaromonas sp.]